VKIFLAFLGTLALLPCVSRAQDALPVGGPVNGQVNGLVIDPGAAARPPSSSSEPEPGPVSGQRPYGVGDSLPSGYIGLVPGPDGYSTATVDGQRFLVDPSNRIVRPMQ
jgi:hypothetical protein